VTVYGQVKAGGVYLRQEAGNSVCDPIQQVTFRSSATGSLKEPNTCLTLQSSSERPLTKRRLSVEVALPETDFFEAEFHDLIDFGRTDVRHRHSAAEPVKHCRAYVTHVTPRRNLTSGKLSR